MIADLGFAQVESIAHSDNRCVVVFDNGTERYATAHSSDTATALTIQMDTTSGEAGVSSGP